jgi:hypothetical protein
MRERLRNVKAGRWPKAAISPLRRRGLFWIAQASGTPELMQLLSTARRVRISLRVNTRIAPA